MMPEFKPDLSPEDRLRVIEGLRKSVQAYPEVVEDIHEYYAGLVERMIARRLDRTLTEAERKTLAKRVEELDRDQLCVTVLDLPTEKLAAWLAEPSAP